MRHSSGSEKDSTNDEKPSNEDYLNSERLLVMFTREEIGNYKVLFDLFDVDGG